MKHTAHRGTRRVTIAAATALIAVAAAIAVQFWRQISPPPPVAHIPAAQSDVPSTAPASRPVTAAPPRDFMSLVLALNPDFPTTQPLVIPLDELHDSARFVFTDPIHIDAGGDLWITRSDAPPVASLLKTASDEQTHLTRDRVVFVYRTIDATGAVQPQVIVARPGDRLELINNTGRIEIGTPGRHYQWDRAMWVARQRDEMIVVPTDTGVSILRPQQRPMELYQEFSSSDSPATQGAAGEQAGIVSATQAPAKSVDPRTSEPQVLLDTRGLLAWIPAENGHAGSRGAARFVDGKWIALDPAAGWPEKILHLVPLLDGNVLQLAVNDDNTVQAALALLDPAEVDAEPIEALVARLSDRDPKVRDAAHDELTRYGSGIWPILERLHDAQPPEARLRIEQLLRAKMRPTLGRMILQEGKVRAVARFSDGGALLFAEAGVSMDSGAGVAEPALVAPAWISIRPGRPIELASKFLVADLKPDTARLCGFSDEWIVLDDTKGPQRFLGNHLEPMLRKADRAFNYPMGPDRRGRWLFRKTPDNGQTLIVDPTLPDPTPRLPAWQYPVSGGAVGWTAEGWPVVKRGGAWVIDRDGTRPLIEKREKLFTELDQMPEAMRPPKPIAQGASATSPLNLPGAAATTQSAEPVLLIDSQGGRYFGGNTALRHVARDGRETIWQMPPAAVGAGRVHLIEAENRLFLFNEPGRVLRIRRQDQGAEPFKLEATFTRNIPNVDQPTRIWLDPAGRIAIAYEGDKLTILFPSGRIPPAIAQRMLASNLKANEEE